MGTYLAYIIGGAVGGLLFVWWVIGQLKAKEQADMTAAGLEAAKKGEAEADTASREAESAANDAKKNAGAGWDKPTA